MIVNYNKELFLAPAIDSWPEHRLLRRHRHRRLFDE